MLRSLAALVAALALAACSASPDQPPSADAPLADCQAGLVEAVDAWGAAGFNGTVATLTGGAECATAAGTLDPETGEQMPEDAVFAIGSVSKSFTAAAILQLVAEDRLELDATAGSLVAGLTGPAADATVAQLLTHTSGINGGAGPDHRPLSRDAAIAAISDLPVTFPAGTDFGYTNAGYTLLALVIDEVTGDHRRYLDEHVLDGSDAGFWDGEPAAAGPRVVGYLDSGRSADLGEFAGPHWATSGNGDLAMSMPTLAAWTAGLFHGELAEEVSTPRWDNGDGTSETFGWVRLGKDVLGAAGFGSAGGGGDTGHNAVVVHLPAADTTIAIASSTPDVTAEELMQAIVPALVAGEPIPLPAGAGAARPDPATIDRVTGTYALDGGGRLVVSGADGAVAVEALGAAAVGAVFGRPAGATAHEAAVLDLLTGPSALGEEERQAVGGLVGGIEDVVLRGTVMDDNELRTYVTIRGAERDLAAWYAVDEQGGVAGAEAPTDPPMLQLDQQRGDTLVSSDPTGRRADVRVTVRGGLLTIDNGTSVATARRTE